MMTGPPSASTLELGAMSPGPAQALESREADRESVEACQRGEREAFGSLVERHQRTVYRLCYRFVNDHHDASDLAQEVFLRAYRGIGRFRADSSFSTWLYRIAVNVCLSFRATRRPEPRELLGDVPDTTTGVLASLEAEERSRRVREAVGRLPEKQRATLILKVYQELTHEEVARTLGTSIGTAKASLFHALANLRKLLAASARRPTGRPSRARALVEKRR